MSAAARLPTILASIAGTTTLTILLLLPRSLLPAALSGHLPPHLRTTLLKALGAAFLLVNLKNVPTTWHIRVLRALQYQIYASPASLKGKDLFRPLVTTTWNSPLDCDYNLHKSNSTYFKDLDVSRAHFVGALLRTGIRRLNAGDKEGLPDLNGAVGVAADKSKAAGGARNSGSKVSDRWIIALGAVACTFRKEIPPMQRFEVWTRLLSWDGKWMYIVSHVVKAGAVKHKGYTMQPWKAQGQSRWWWSLSGSSRGRATTGDGGEEQLRRAADKATAHLDEDIRRAVYATSIAKYVCKKGRLTIPPELVLQRSRLIPSTPKPAHLTPTRPTAFGNKPEGITARSEADLLLVSRHGGLASGAASGTATPMSAGGLEGVESTALSGVAAAASAATGTASADDAADSGAGPEHDDADLLSWDVIERLRLAGLEYAQQLDGLAGLHDEFGHNEGPEGLDADEGAPAPGAREVLGVYSDFAY